MSSSELQALFSSLRPRSSQDRNSASPAPAQSSRETASPLPTAGQTAARTISPTANSDHASPPQPSNATAQNLLSLLNFKGSSNVISSPQVSTSRTASASRQDSSNIISEMAGQKSPLLESSNTNLNTNSFFQAGTPGASPSPVNNTSDRIENKPLFTYTNPFEALNASRTQTPNIAAAEKTATPSFTETSQNTRDSTTAEIASRKILTPKLRSQRNEGSPQPMPLQPAGVVNVPVLKDESDGGEKSTKPTGISAGKVKATVETEKRGTKELPETQPGKKSQSNTDNVNGDDGSGDWEDSDEVVSQRVVPVYNFPIKAFVTINLHLDSATNIGIRQGSVMEISRLKKDFDQLDRSLAAATSKYIGYAFTKHGGLRIIRQDDGSDRHVFKNSHDRIFNVTFCTTSVLGPPGDAQAILGTGISGTVYYASLWNEEGDVFENNGLEQTSLIFPPFTLADDNTAGGLLKTRAKRSSRHPEFFAIGRGRFIHLIWPEVASNSYYRAADNPQTVDVDKLHEKRPVYVQTGKAGKDFTFSEDDTCIVSLDKTGRLRFWDIRPLIESSGAAASKANPLVVDKPILSLSTASPTEKLWPTSVLFVDKARAYIKGSSLRYVLVGLRQNHTLQLWDIALSKAVQELNFPHTSETDGICSICYHPASGIVVVGHPTRNSIFFVHLSAPKYMLSSQLAQAAYVTLIANKDPSVPTPEATACFTGIREVSFADKGELRSVELLPVQKASDSMKSQSSSKNENDTSVLFELYVAHSKGVTCLAINREDLGWDAKNKVIQGIDAKKEGIVKVTDLTLGSVIEEPSPSKSPSKETLQQPSKASKKKAKKAAQAVEEVLQNVANDQKVKEIIVTTESVVPPPAENVVQETPKESKKAKKKALQVNDQSISKNDARSVSPVKKSHTPERVSDESVGQPTKIDQSASSLSNDSFIKELQKIDQNVSAEFRKQLAILQENISADRTSLDQASLTRQESIIRLVSSSLSTNVEKSLSRIVTQKIESDVLPALLQSTSLQISNILGKQLQQAVSREVNAGLSSTVTRSLEAASSTSIPEAVSRKLSTQIEKQLSDAITRTITPLCQTLAQTTAEQTAITIQSQLSGQLQKLQADHAADRMRLDKLNQALQGMATTLQTMSESQLAFQEQLLRERRNLDQHSHRQLSTGRLSPSATALVQPIPVKPKSEAEIELEDVSNMMERGHYEEGTIKWLQSSQPVSLFDEVFVRFTPDYLATEVSPLVAFSVAVTVANALENNIERRIEWISAALDAVDASDPEMTDLSQHAPALISAIVQKLESLYMMLAERQSDDPILKPIPSLVKKARSVGAIFLTKG